jgi:glutaredoxin-dependent peroxiredoxin
MGLLRDRGGELRAAGVDFYGISRDSPWTHIAWQQALDLDFPLLSDWNGEATNAFAIAHELRGLQGVAQRSAFILDADGTIRFARAYEDGELPDLDEVLAALRELQKASETGSNS